MALNPNSLRLAEHARNTFTIVLDISEGLDAVFDPAFWAHAAARLTVRDKVEVFAADNSWYAELIVTEVSKNSARVACLVVKKLETGKAPKAPLTADTPPRDGLYFREWVAKDQAHRVVRNSDRQVMQNGLTKDEAEALIVKLTAEATLE